MAQAKRSEVADEVQALPASLPRTCSPERLADFLERSGRGDDPGGAGKGRDRARLVYPAGYLRWLASVPGRDAYMDAVLIDAARQIVGVAISRPLTLGMWSNMKLRAAIKETLDQGRADRSAQGWVRYLTRTKDDDLAPFATLLPEEHYALRAAALEFLRLAPGVADRSRERLLLDVVLGEARAAGYDYLLCWGDDLPLPPGRAAHAVAAEAVLDALPAGDSGLLGICNLVRYSVRAVRLWVERTREAIRRAIRQACAWLARLPGRIRRWVRRARWWSSSLEGEARSELGARVEEPEAPPAPGPGSPAAPGPGPEVATFDGVRIRCLGSPGLPLDEDLLEALLQLLAGTQERYGIFPTYDRATLRALVTPAVPGARLAHLYAAHREGHRSALLGAAHDVLSFVGLDGDRPVAFLFGHRLPVLDEAGEAEEAWLVRMASFAPDLGVLSRADIVQRCVEAAESQYGIRRVLLLREAGLREFALSRLVQGGRPASGRLALHYLPLSERAVSEEAILARRLPVGYI